MQENCLSSLRDFFFTITQFCWVLFSFIFTENIGTVVETVQLQLHGILHIIMRGFFIPVT